MDINENEEQIIEDIEPSSTEAEDLADSNQGKTSDGDQVEIGDIPQEPEVLETNLTDGDDPNVDPGADGVEEELEPEFIEELPVMEQDLPGDGSEDQEQDLTDNESVKEETEPEQELMDEESIGEESEQDPVVEEPEEEEAVLDDSDEQDIPVEQEEEASPELETQPIPEVQPLAVPVIDDGRAWFVVHCYSGNEDKVRHNIMQRIESMSMDDLIFDVIVPTEDEINIKNGERQTIEKKVFPGYILVNMILTEESWYMVRNTPGVTGFVGMGNDPTPLQPEEVARILKRMESESPRINVTFRPGERVRIVDGPFEDFYGKVSEIDMERATVRVMVNFFGRETPVELDFLQVEEA
jgi:transcriptional antiterminator NusG